ncbi:MAG: hypothetical protein UT64_C0068G0001, partial [Candidatus Falkowbacteria bacterium GW2011_GWF2_39_8]
MKLEEFFYSYLFPTAIPSGRMINRYIPIHRINIIPTGTTGIFGVAYIFAIYIITYIQ